LLLYQIACSTHIMSLIIDAARVYAILSGQLLVTALSVVLFGTHPAFLRWQNPMTARIPVTLSLLLSTVSWFFVVSSPTARRKAPYKWQLLTLFTLGEAVTVGFLSSFYKFRSVVTSMVATTVATLAISIYTIRQRNPKYDLSQWGAGLSS
jgi:FtsH-binding integral membrane protein